MDISDIDKAVALKYTPELPAPFVIAKGRGEIAEKICRIAEAHGIALLTEPELTENLIELDTGDFIPEIYYQLVAEILCFVRNIQEQK